MQNIHISKGKFTPEVVFDPAKGILNFAGNSFPENADLFYTPLLKQIEQRLAEFKGEGLAICFHFNYVNSSSIKFLLKLFDLLSAKHNQNLQIAVTWIYENDDSDIFELGQSISNNFGLPFVFKINA